MSTLVAFGNLEKPFDRMARSVRRELAAMPGPVFIQAGANHALREWASPDVFVFPTCSFEDFDQLVVNAAVVITHGGAGTIQAAVSRGLRPAVFVRQGSLGEHVDNHQSEWCQRVFAADLAVEMRDDESLRDYLAEGRFTHDDAAAALALFDCSALRADLHGYIRSIVTGK